MLENPLHVNGGMLLGIPTVHRRDIGVGDQRVVGRVGLGVAKNLEHPGFLGLVVETLVIQ